MIDTFVFDLEGTLSNDSHRQNLKKDLDKWHRAFSQDHPNYMICNLYRNLCFQSSVSVVIATAKPECYRQMVLDWLSTRLLPLPDLLLMRRGDDLDTSPVVKWNMICELRMNGLNPIGLFDDRKDVCAKISEECGIPTYLVRTE